MYRSLCFIKTQLIIDQDHYLCFFSLIANVIYRSVDRPSHSRRHFFFVAPVLVLFPYRYLFCSYLVVPVSTFVLVVLFFFFLVIFFQPLRISSRKILNSVEDKQHPCLSSLFSRNGCDLCFPSFINYNTILIFILYTFL
jgi:hypothetical protein